MRCVDEVVVQDNMDKLQAVIKYNVDVVFVGSDWKGTEAWNNYEKEFAKVGCSVVYLEHTDGISSSILRDRLNSGESALQWGTYKTRFGVRLRIVVNLDLISKFIIEDIASRVKDRDYILRCLWFWVCFNEQY